TPFEASTMDYENFKKLVAKGERANVDFKIECNAFVSRGKAEKAELAKDVCAMCNNGNTRSYLLIGVSDDGLNFKAVTNPNLTPDNFQTFVKDAVSPPPKATLERVIFAKAAPEHRGMEFAIIEIGPHRRQAFCIAKDFIDYKEKVCIRQYDV